MDEPTARARVQGRRMASARPDLTVRQRRATGATSGASSGGASGHEISRARWAGVGLVVAALLGAITLGVLSPGGRGPGAGGSSRGAGVVGASASPAALASPTDTRLPAVKPEILSPKEGWVIGEWYTDVSVDVPEEPLPRRLLELVILRGGEAVKSVARPKTGERTTVADVPLVAGVNVVTAALRGPGGLGPGSEPVTVTQDRDAPVLEVTAPKDGTETIEERVTVSGTSEPGSAVEVDNRAKGWEGQLTVGPSGSFEIVVPLAMGKNRIVASSTDTAGMERQDEVVVVREDGRPVITLTAPGRVRRAELPRQIRVSVVVKDVDGDAIEGATVSYGLGGPGGTTEDFSEQTDGAGRSSWLVEIGAGGSPTNPIVSVEVIAPNGERSQAFREITIS